MISEVTSVGFGRAATAELAAVADLRTDGPDGGDRSVHLGHVIGSERSRRDVEVDRAVGDPTVC